MAEHTEQRATIGSAAGSTVAQLWSLLEERLAATSDIAAPRQEARDIIASAFQMPRLWPAAHGDDPAPPYVVALAELFAERRACGAPFAYAVGRAAFRHMTLTVDERVLIPRQETEQLVDVVLARCASLKGAVAIDVGTGSGAIALALATEGRAHFSKVFATDISGGALSIARSNAAAVLCPGDAEVEFICTDLLNGLGRHTVNAVVSNPPYIAYEERWSLPISVRNWEPPEALFSHRRGMATIERLVRDSAAVLVEGGLLAIEVDSLRAREAADFVRSVNSFTNVSTERDLTGRDRFVFATRENS